MHNMLIFATIIISEVIERDMWHWAAISYTFINTNYLNLSFECWILTQSALYRQRAASVCWGRNTFSLVWTLLI